MMKDKLNCKDCEFLKCYAVLYQNYYCDHEDRTDDMGKLTERNLREECPAWCPRLGQPAAIEKIDYRDSVNSLCCLFSYENYYLKESF